MIWSFDDPSHGIECPLLLQVYDVTDPAHSKFVQYINNRNFEGVAEAGTSGDLGPEGIIFIKAVDSPTGGDLLVVGNEVSGTTTLYTVTQTEDKENGKKCKGKVKTKCPRKRKRGRKRSGWRLRKVWKRKEW